MSYTADKSGYKAVVKYTEDTATVSNPVKISNDIPHGAYFAVTPKPVYYDDYGGESAYLGSRLAPYVVEGFSEGRGTYLDEYGSEVYDPGQVIYRK